MVLAAEHRAVEVDLGDDFLGAGQLHSGVDRDLRFQHTADHALHAVHLSGGGNAQGIGDAAALHQLDVHQVGRAGLHDPQGICRAEHALVGQHGHIGMAGDILHPLKVCGGHGLLHELNVQPLLLHLVQDADRLLGVPGLIGIDAELDVPAHGLPHRGKAGHIQFRVNAYLDLQAVVAALDGGAGIPGHLLRRVDTDGDIGHDVPAGTAQHPVNRGTVLLAQQIPQGHVHSGLGAGVVDKRLLHSGGQILKFIEVAAQQGRGDMILNGTEDGPGGVAGDDTGRGCFAVAHRTGIGVELHDNILNAVHSAQCRFERHPQRGGNAAQPHLCDLHSPVLLLIPAAGLPA